MTELEKQAAVERQKKLLARRTEFYRDHPEAERFVRKKSQLLKFLLLYCFGVRLGKAVLLGIASGTGLAVLLFALVMGFGMNAIVLAAGMGPKWKLAFVLYGWALYSLYRSFDSIAGQGIVSIPELAAAYGALFAAAPAAAVLDLLSWLFIVLVLLTAAWLTLLPKNRRLAEEAEALEEQWKAYIAVQPVSKSK